MFDYSTDMRNSLYSRTRNRGWRGQVWSALTGRSRRLFTLAEIDATCNVHARRHAGIRTVPMGQIRGTQDRGHDFDRDFNPLQDRTKRRWLGIAAARQRGKPLPPVQLVQVGDVYFVQDGHHRISVARALGQQAIEARVMVWQVTGSLPWEESAATHSPTGQGAGIGHLTSKVRDESARLQEHFLLSLRNLLATAGAKSRAQVLT
jgi:hypothetical protein